MVRRNSRSAKKNGQGAGRLWRRVLLILAGMTAGLNLYRWNAAALAGNALPMPFGTGAAVVLSGSMSPALEVNDLILVQKKEHYGAGDIVVYQSGAELIVHRIIAQEGKRVTTKGDANSVADVPIDAGMIKGAVTVRIPLLGAVVNGLKLPAVSILLFIGALFLMERSFRAEKRAEEENLDEMKEEIRRLKAELAPGEQMETGRKGTDGRETDRKETGEKETDRKETGGKKKTDEKETEGKAG